MSFPWKKSRRILTRLVFLLALCLFLFGALLPNMVGYPAWIRDAAAQALTPDGGSCTLGKLCGDPVTGFELTDVKFQTPTPAGELKVEIPVLSFAMHPLALLKGQFSPKELQITNASAVLVLPKDGDLPEESIVLDPLTGSLQVSSADLMQGDFTGNLLGVHIQFSVDLTDADALKDMHANEPAAVPQVNPALTKALRILTEAASPILTQASHASLSLHLMGSCREPAQFQEIGSLKLNECTVYGWHIADCHGNFLLQNNILQIPDFHLILNDSESITCQGILHLDTQSLSAKFYADIMPESLLKLGGLPDRALASSKPIHLDGQLQDTRWNSLRKEAVTDVGFSCKDLALGGLRFQNIDGILRYDGKTLAIDALEISAEDCLASPIRGKISLDCKSQEIQGELKGALNIEGLCQELQLSFLKTLSLKAPSPLFFEADLKPSPLTDWKSWEWDIDIAQENFQLGFLPLCKAKILLGLHQDNLAFSLDADADCPRQNHFSLNASTRLTDCLSGMPFPIDIAFLSQIDNQEALRLATTIVASPEASTLELPRGMALVRPELFPSLLNEFLSLDSTSPLTYFQCLSSDEPANLVFHLPETSWESFASSEDGLWKLHGIAFMPKMRLLDTDFDALQTTVVLTRNSIEFPELLGDFQGDSGFTRGHLSIWFTPFRLCYDDLYFRGAPLAITHLLYGESAMDVYHDIWKDFVWDPENPPLLHVDHMEYLSQNANGWKFTLEGRVDATRPTYHGTTLQNLHTRVTLNLPDKGLLLSDCGIQDLNSPEESLQGSARLHFEDGIDGEFFLKKTAGTLRLKELAISIFPTMQEHIEDFEFSPEIRFGCAGKFQWDSLLDLSIAGTMDTPYIQYRMTKLQDVRGTWRTSKEFFAWDFPEAEFYGGNLSSSGEYAFDSGRCELLTHATGIPLSELMKISSGKFVDKEIEDVDRKYAAGEMPGKMDFEGHIHCLLEWAAIPVYLEGSGNIHIYDADLWRVPALLTLGKIISQGTSNFFSKDKIASLGKISTLDTDVECHGTTIAFDNIRTNGSFIALSGNGNYRIDERQMKFRVSGKLLQNVSLISWLLKPLSWAFDAELTGTPEEHRWELHSFFRKHAE